MSVPYRDTPDLYLDESRDVVFRVVEWMDAMFRGGYFREVEATLRDVDTDRMDPAAIVAMLNMASIAQRRRDADFGDLFERCRTSLTSKVGYDRAERLTARRTPT